MLAILIVVMQIANDRFLSPANVGNLLGQMTVMLIVAAGMTIVMIAGEFDVSVGSVVGSVGRRGRLDHGPMDAGAERRRSSLVGDRARTDRAPLRRARCSACSSASSSPRRGFPRSS